MKYFISTGNQLFYFQKNQYKTKTRKDISYMNQKTSINELTNAL